MGGKKEGRKEEIKERRKEGMKEERLVGGAKFSMTQYWPKG